MKMLKRFSAVILITLAFMAFIAVTLYTSIKTDRVRYEKSRKDLISLKFEYVKGVISENSIRAKMQIEEVSKNTVNEILVQVPSTAERALLLSTLNGPGDNKIIDIIGKNIKPVYMNVHSDANDAWAANLAGIISDYSADCSANGRSRSFESEIALHSNKVLARLALNRILSLDVIKNIDAGSIDDAVFWEFRKSNNDGWKLISSMTIDELYNVFCSNDGDIRCFFTYEFLYPNYIYSDRDILGREIVNSRGMWQGNKSYPLILVQGWNLYDALTANQTHTLAMAQFDTKLQNLAERQWENELYKTLLLIAIVVIFLIVQLSTVQIIHNETKRMMEEELADEASGRQ